MLSILAPLALAAHLATPVEDTAQARREALMAKLRNGGYTVLLRHARTDYSTQEPQGTVPAERSAQRNLSDEGIRDAALMGVVFRKYGISFAEVIASPMYRTVETAEMAASHPKTTMALRSFPSTPEQAALIKTAPKPGTNRLLVTHHFVIETHVPGVQPGAVAESEAAVVSHAPDGTPQLVGFIKLDDWKALANPSPRNAAATKPATAPAAPAVPAVAPTIPDTPAGKLAARYLAAFNSGDTTTMRRFFETAFAPNPNRPMEERLKSFTTVFSEHGPLTLVSVDSSTATKVSLGTQGKKGALGIHLQTSDSNPALVGSISLSTFRPHS
jgi:phosphohistidine phosphatase SixA